MKTICLTVMLIFAFHCGWARREGRALIDSLNAALPGIKDDTSRVRMLAAISYEMRNISPRDALVPGLQALSLAQKTAYAYGEGLAHYSLIYIYHFLSRLPESVGHALQAREIFERLGEVNHLCATELMLAYLYKDLDRGIAESYMQKAEKLIPSFTLAEWKIRNYGTLGNNFRNFGQLDSALKYMRIHLQLAGEAGLQDEVMIERNRFGYFCLAQSNYDSAFSLISEGLAYFRSVGSTRMISENLTSLGRIRLRQSQSMKEPQCSAYLREAAVLAAEGLEAAASIGYLIQCYTSDRLLSDIFLRLGDKGKAYRYLDDAIRDYDSVYGARIINKASVLSWKTEKQLKEQQVELLKLRNRQQKGIISAAAAGVAILMIIVILIVNSRRRMKKAYLVVKQHEEEISRVVRELEVTNSRMEAANQELEAFSYSVSHDLRAPVRRIEGLSSMLREDYDRLLDEDGRMLLERISSSSVMMNQLIEEMLKLSKITRSSVNRKMCNLSGMAIAICDDLRLSYPGHRVKCSIEPGISVKADENLLGIVLQNLLDNAFKYSSRTEKAEIIIRSEEIEGRRHIVISDNGAGFDMNRAGNLFTPFQRMHSDEQFKGTGIGLATVKRIISRHGGVISAQSEPGKGTSFTFTLE